MASIIGEVEGEREKVRRGEGGGGGLIVSDFRSDGRKIGASVVRG